MGYCPFYQALPDESDLARLLRTDRQSLALMTALFPNGSRPFDLWEVGEGEIGDTLDWLSEEDDVFASREEAERTLDHLRAEMERATSRHPGLVDRMAYLEKTQDDIEERLVQRFGEESRPFWRDVIGGERPFAPEMVGEGLGQLWIVTPATVVEAARLLREIEPVSLFGDEDEDYILEDFRDWRALFLEAAERGEAVLVL